MGSWIAKSAKTDIGGKTIKSKLIPVCRLICVHCFSHVLFLRARFLDQKTPLPLPQRILRGRLRVSGCTFIASRGDPTRHSHDHFSWRRGQSMADRWTFVVENKDETPKSEQCSVDFCRLQEYWSKSLEVVSALLTGTIGLLLLVPSFLVRFRNIRSFM